MTARYNNIHPNISLPMMVKAHASAGDTSIGSQTMHASDSVYYTLSTKSTNPAVQFGIAVLCCPPSQSQPDLGQTPHPLTLETMPPSNHRISYFRSYRIVLFLPLAKHCPAVT
jgi:hypothetical protein